MIFRKATEKDIEKVAEVYTDIHTCEEKGITCCGWTRGVYPSIEVAQKSFERDDLFVCDLDGEIAGTAIINKIQLEEYKIAPWLYEADDDRVMVLHTFAISSKAARKGLGRKFVEFYEQYALSEGCDVLRMDTSYKNSIARAMYKKLGYREADIVDCTFNGMPEVRLVLLEKKLSLLH